MVPGDLARPGRRRAARERHRHLLPAPGRRALALAPGRCRGDLAPLRRDPLELAVGGEPPVVLGPEVASGQVPQAIVPAGAWQSARSLGAWTLVGCTVSPAFRFEGFELVPDGWSP